jgi:hypothetical protein
MNINKIRLQHNMEDYNIKIMKHQGTWEVRKLYSIQFNSFSIRRNT